MKLENTASSRKSIVAWYDSEPVCIFALCFLLLVLLFSLAGIGVARQIPDYNDYLWVPVVMTVLSGLCFVSIFLRLMRRYLSRWLDREEP